MTLQQEEVMYHKGHKLGIEAITDTSLNKLVSVNVVCSDCHKIVCSVDDQEVVEEGIAKYIGKIHEDNGSMSNINQTYKEYENLIFEAAQLKQSIAIVRAQLSSYENWTRFYKFLFMISLGTWAITVICWRIFY